MKYVKDFEALDKLRSPLEFNEMEVGELLKINLEKENYKNLRYLVMNYGSMACCREFLLGQLLGELGVVDRLDRLFEGGSISFFKSFLKYDKQYVERSFVYACKSGRMDVFKLFFKPYSEIGESLIGYVWHECVMEAVRNGHSNIYNHLVETPLPLKLTNVHEHLYKAAALFGNEDLVAKLFNSVSKVVLINTMVYLSHANQVKLVSLLRKSVKFRNGRSLILMLLEESDLIPQLIDIIEEGRRLAPGTVAVAAAHGRVGFISWAFTNRQVPESELKEAITEAIVHLQSGALIELVNFGTFDDSFNLFDLAPQLRTFVTELKAPFFIETLSTYLESKAVWAQPDADVIFMLLSPAARIRLAYWAGRDGNRGICDGTKLAAFYHDERSLEAFLAGSLNSHSSQNLYQIWTFKSLNDPQGPSLIPRIAKLIGSCSFINSNVFDYLCAITNAESNAKLHAQLNEAILAYLSKSKIRITQ